MTTSESSVIVCPERLTLEIISHFHDGPCFSHLGIAKTLEKIKRRFYFRSMSQKVRDYVKSCPTCQKFKYSNQKPSGLMGVEPEVSQVFEHIYFDVIGPLPKYRNLEHILICTDKVSGWIEVKAVSNVTATKIVTFLEDDVFCRFGFPRVMVTDNASYLNCRTMRTFCKTFNINHRFTANYHQQTNKAEREIRNIKPMLAIALENHKNWPELLQKFAFALRTAARENHWFTPAHINLGRSLALPIDTIVNSSCDTNAESAEELANSLPDQVQNILKFVRESLYAAKIANKALYDKKRSINEVEIGHKVWLRNRPRSSKDKNESAKLMPKWSGPFEISHFTDDSKTTVELRDIQSGKLLPYKHHVSDIKPFIEREKSEVNKQSHSKSTNEEATTDDKLKTAIIKSELRGLRRSKRLQQKLLNLL